MALVSCQKCAFFMHFWIFCFISAEKINMSSQYCPFFNNRAPSAQPGLKNCTWFKENSCCLQQEIEATFGRVKPLKGASHSCQKLINFLMCYVCAPDQNIFYHNERLTVCESFCDKLFDACKSAILKGSHIRDLYSNGKEFCLSRRFLVRKNEGCFSMDSDVVLNKSSRTNFSMVSLFAAVFIYVAACLVTTGNVTGFIEKNAVTSRVKISSILSCGLFYICLISCAVIFQGAFCNARTLATKSTIFDLATALSDELSVVAKDGLKYQNMQSYFEHCNHTTKYMNGSHEILRLRQELSDFFGQRQLLAEDLATKIGRIYDDCLKRKSFHFTSLENLPGDIYKDADFIDLKHEPHCDYDSNFKTVVCLNRSVVKIPDNVDRSNVNVIDTVHWTAALDALFKKNKEADSSIRWQYFGSSYGVLRTYPGREWQRNFVGFTEDFDPRTRPWFLSVTSSPKDVVLILDTSSSMSNKRLSRLKAVTRNVLSTLTKLDRVNIVLSRSPYWKKNGDYVDKKEKVLVCDSSLVPATTSNLQNLLSLVEDISADGGSEHLSAFRRAFRMLEAANATGEQSCQSVVIFITDGQTKDTFENRCDKGYLRYREDSTREYVPGHICVYDYDKFHGHVEQLQSKLHHRAHIFTFLVDEENADTHQFTAQMPCQHGGVFVKVTEDWDVLGAMQPYYDYMGASSGRMHESEWSSPYLDRSGLGLMITVSASVYSNMTGRLLGVVGIDVPLAQVENIIRRASWSNVYGFLVDRNDLTAVLHPFLKPPVQLASDPIFVPVEQVETHAGRPQLFSDVMQGIVNGGTGSVTITTDAMRVVSKDESLSWQPVDSNHYVYASIPDTDLSVVLNIGEDDDVTVKQAASSSGHVTYLHHMELYNQQSHDLPGVYEILKPNRSHPRYPEIEISSAHSVVKLSPRAFCDPGAFLQEDKPDFAQIHRYLNSDDRGDHGDAASCSHSVFVPGVKTDVILTAQLEADWKSRDASLQDHVVWTYVGTASGVMRIYPGVRMRKEYDPTQREWYLRTLANGARGLTLSRVYADAIPNIGSVVTVSKAIRQPAPASPKHCSGGRKELGCACDSQKECARGSCHYGYCASNSVEAVVAMDIRYDDFRDRVLRIGQRMGVERACGSSYSCEAEGGEGQTELCQTVCYIVTDTAHLSFASDTSSLHGHDVTDKQTTLAHVQGHVFSRLLQHGVFVSHVREDYQAVCHHAGLLHSEVVMDMANGPSPRWHYNQADTQMDSTGPIRPFNNQYSCVKQVVYYTANRSALSDTDPVLTGSLENDPCANGRYFFTAVPDMNVFLLVLENYRKSQQDLNFNCHISNSVLAPGSFDIQEEVCGERKAQGVRGRRRCGVQEIAYPCGYSRSKQLHIQLLPTVIAAMLSLILLI